MGRNKYIDKENRRIVLDKMRDEGIMSTEDIMNLIRPCFMWNADEARERDLKRQVNNLVRTLKDERNIRSCFKLDEDDTYVNVDVCQDAKKVGAIENQLYEKYQGLQVSHDKVQDRRKQIEGQANLARFKCK